MYPTSSIPQCLSPKTIRHLSLFTKFNLTACHVKSHFLVVMVVRTQIMISRVSDTKQGQQTLRIFSEIQKSKSIFPKAVMSSDGRSLTTCFLLI